MVTDSWFGSQVSSGRVSNFGPKRRRRALPAQGSAEDFLPVAPSGSQRSNAIFQRNYHRKLIIRKCSRLFRLLVRAGDSRFSLRAHASNPTDLDLRAAGKIVDRKSV